VKFRLDTLTGFCHKYPPFIPLTALVRRAMTASEIVYRVLRTSVCAVGFAIIAAGLTGCQWAQTHYQSLRGEGFKDYQGGSSLRGDTGDAKPSGFFTDKRSDQIEQNLGGF